MTLSMTVYFGGLPLIVQLYVCASLYSVRLTKVEAPSGEVVTDLL